MDAKLENCLRACNTCADACDSCATACLKEADLAAMTECIRLDMDCAAFCRLAAGYVARGSTRSRDICRLCADICEACGDECAKHKADHCQRCAAACRACAAECRKMSA